MSNLADQIEQYIKRLFQKSAREIIELQRNELAGIFSCAPSQINYVLGTRFSFQQGYLVESRRGGGGYLKIIKLTMEPGDELAKLVTETVGDQINERSAAGLIRRLLEDGLITGREALMMNAALGRDTLQLPVAQRDVLRARILKALLLALLRSD